MAFSQRPHACVRLRPSGTRESNKSSKSLQSLGGRFDPRGGRLRTALTTGWSSHPAGDRRWQLPCSSRPRPRATCIHGHRHYLGHWLRPSTASGLTSVTGHVLPRPQALPRARATSIHGLRPYFVFRWRVGRRHTVYIYCSIAS